MLFVVGAALVAGAPTGHAHLSGKKDPDDVGGRLDVRRAAVERQAGEVTVDVKTYEKIRDRDLIGGGFSVRFDSRGGRAVDFSLRMDLYEGGRPWCTFYDDEGFSRYETEATRRRRSFSCTVPSNELEATKHLRWRVGTVDGDKAPEAGWYRH
jgi:hypothetical protein